jgi:hypothetical protein
MSRDFRLRRKTSLREGTVLNRPQELKASCAADAPRTAGFRAARVRTAIVLAALALVYFYRIDRPLLWGDEAETGIIARNVLRSGFPIATDGRNVTLYDDGVQLNRNLLVKRTPWVQYYWGALSLALFGNTTGGLRVLFAAAGLLAFFPIRAVLKSRVAQPEITAALALLAPQIVLFQRNARYYPILILLYSLLVWHLYADFRSVWKRLALATLILVLLFHTHPFAAACAGLSLILFCLIFRREALPVYCIASAAGFLSWAVWYASLGPPLCETPLRLWAIPEQGMLWFRSFFADVLAGLVDLDAVDCLPLLLCATVLGLLAWRGRRVAASLLREPLVAFTLLNVLIQVVATAGLIGSETGAGYALLRYMPHLLVFTLLACFLALHEALPVRRLYAPIAAAAVACNALTFSFWAAPLARDLPVSWLPDVYEEVFRPEVGPWDNLIARLRLCAPGPAGLGATLVALPPWTQEIALFYLGDRYRVTPFLGPLAEPGRQALRRVMGEEASARLFAPPDWIVDSLGLLKRDPAGYVTVAVFPANRLRPDDGARPELTRHSFRQRAGARNVRLLERQP